MKTNYMAITKARREEQGLCIDCGGEKERKKVKCCNSCIAKGVARKKESRLHLKLSRERNVKNELGYIFE